MRERRKQRSAEPLEALKLFLARVSEEESLRAAVICDADGILIEGTRRDASVDLEALAALRQGPAVKAKALRYANETLYLVTLGADSKRPTRASIATERPRAAVGRILDLT